MANPLLSMPVPQDTPRFADLARQNILHPKLLQTLAEDLKFDHMMPVQAATLHELLQNKIDCLAQARTGTGKTLSFLLPAIQGLIAAHRNARDDKIPVLILAPTRELAMQIGKEATALLQRFPEYRVLVVMGGTNKNTEAKALDGGCEILVATPGRLLDHLSSGDPGRLAAQFFKLQTLIVDEADRMLDMGFLPDIKKILARLPGKGQAPRQSMLFSATVAGQIQNVAHLILKKDYKFISTIPAGEASTHERVPQFLVTVETMSDVTAAMTAAIRAERAAASPKTPFKAIVFAPTAAHADFYGHVLSAVTGLPAVSVLHSRVTQSKRTATTQAFREASSAICVATDIIARGMDFPAVSHVFQVGMPAEKEDYIHRLGRTARAGAEGRGILILAKPELHFFGQLVDVKVESYPQRLEYSREDVAGALASFEDKQTKTYQAWLGFYKSHLKALKWSPAELVKQANAFALQGLGCQEVPALEKRIISKMGLKGEPGLRVAPPPPRKEIVEPAMVGGEGIGGGRGSEGANRNKGGKRGKYLKENKEARGRQAVESKKRAHSGEEEVVWKGRGGRGKAAREVNVR